MAFFCAATCVLSGQQLAERRAARAAQALVDKDRLIRHQRVAIELLLLPKLGREKLLARAMGSDTLEWGTALRQNSPWPVAAA